MQGNYFDVGQYLRQNNCLALYIDIYTYIPMYICVDINILYKVLRRELKG